MSTTEQFVTYTNIEELLTKEIRTICGDDTEECREHLSRIDEYIKVVFNRFVKIPQAWLWTVLRHLTLNPSMFTSNWFLLHKYRLQKCYVEIKVIFFVEKI